MKTILGLIAAVSLMSQAFAFGQGCGAFCGRCGTPSSSVGKKAVEPQAEEATPPTPSRGMGGMTAAEHDNISALLSGHASVTRKVEEIPGGVKTTTTTSKPELVDTLRSHVRQMARHVEEQRPVRMWDPVFRDVFAHAPEIKLEVRDIEGGVEVIEKSDDPEATAAIRAHAKKVDSFVSGGHNAARPPWAGGGRGRGMRGR